MSDPRAQAMFGSAVATDPYEGLPAHMVASVPHTVRVTVYQRTTVTIGGEQKIVLDARPREFDVQLERGGVPLTKSDARGGWERGERDGWREWPVPPDPQNTGDIIEIEAEECE